MPEPSWDDSTAFLLSLDRVPAAQATGQLLAGAKARWSGHVVPRTSMHDLLFTLPGEEFPFTNQLRVSWSDGSFEFWLLVDNVEVERERVARDGAADAVDVYMTRLVGTP